MRLFRALALLVLAASAVPVALVVWLLTEERGGVDAVVLGAAAGSLALAVVLSALVARRVAAPVAEVARGALDIARGRFGREVKVLARNEIGDLAYTFNHMSRELASYDAENRRLIAALERGYVDTIRGLAGAVEAKDPYTRGHAQRVAALAVEIGRAMRLPEADLRALEYGGLLHDIGKIGIPDAVLSKKDPLTAAEIEIVRTHPLVGAEIVRDVAFLGGTLPAIRSHHERWDGSGYPDHLAGEAIPLVARIVNAADTWDACTSERPYQRAFSAEEAEALLVGLRGTQVEPAVHDALVAVLRARGVLPAGVAAASPEPAPAAEGAPR